MMPINATLARLVLTTPQPEALASFYAKAFGYAIATNGETHSCDGPNRSLWLRHGPANQLLESQFVFADALALESHAAGLRDRHVDLTCSTDQELSVVDPDGRRLRFSVDAASHAATVDARPARIQHYALRSPSPQALVDFYVGQLGFTASDMVRDDAGDLSAAFLRTDAEHHALAIFRSPEARFDHFSCETDTWNSLRDWADHMAGESVPLAWGVGRHGPGNDLFFMVKDPDGNLVEISSDLEVCADDRPVGLWPHRPETLNRWGIALMRS